MCLQAGCSSFNLSGARKVGVYTDPRVWAMPGKHWKAFPCPSGILRERRGRFHALKEDLQGVGLCERWLDGASLRGADEASSWRRNETSGPRRGR